MNTNDREAFIEVVLGFAELKGKQLSAPALELYWRSMQHWPLDEFREAAEHLLRTCEFMPVPKNFEDLRKAGELTPGEAWLDALSYGCVRGTRAWRAAQVVGGSERLMMANIETELPHLQRRFLKAYEELTDVDDVRESLPHIAAPREGNRRVSHNGFASLGDSMGGMFLELPQDRP